MQPPRLSLRPVSSGPRAGRLLAPVLHLPAAGVAVLHDGRRNSHPSSGERHSLSLPALPARSDSDLLHGTEDHDPEAHAALLSAAVWQGGEPASQGDESHPWASISLQRASCLILHSQLPLMPNTCVMCSENSSILYQL